MGHSGLVQSGLIELTSPFLFTLPAPLSSLSLSLSLSLQLQWRTKLSTLTHHHHHQAHILKRIAVDYTPELCLHSPESDTITLTYDHRGGARWRSTIRYLYGTFKSKILCPKGNTSGLNFNIYLSSLEGDKTQDEIDFEFLGKDKNIVQTNYYSSGIGNKEAIHDLGFDCSDGFHEYCIVWGPNVIEWWIDGKMVRKVERGEGEWFPEKPMFLYASIWDASYIAEGSWTGAYTGCDAPFVCVYKDVHVPVSTAVDDCSCDS